MKRPASVARCPLPILAFALLGLFLAGGTGCAATVSDEDADADVETREQELRVGGEIPNPDGAGDCKGSTNPDGCVDCWAQRDESCIECGAGDVFCCRHPDKCDVLNDPTSYRPPTGGTGLQSSDGSTWRHEAERKHPEP